MTRDDTVRLIDLLSGTYGGQWGDKIEAWTGLLVDLPAPAVMDAARIWCRQNDRPPRPANLRELATPNRGNSPAEGRRYGAGGQRLFGCSACEDTGWVAIAIRALDGAFEGKLYSGVTPCGRCEMGARRKGACDHVDPVVGHYRHLGHEAIRPPTPTVRFAEDLQEQATVDVIAWSRAGGESGRHGACAKLGCPHSQRCPDLVQRCRVTHPQRSCPYKAAWDDLLLPKGSVDARPNRPENSHLVPQGET